MQNSTSMVNIREAVRPSRDNINVSDIKGAFSPPNVYFRERNVDSSHITGQQIKNYPSQKQRFENLGYRIRNPMYHDFHYKDLRSQSSVPDLHSKQYSQNNNNYNNNPGQFTSSNNVLKNSQAQLPNYPQPLSGGIGSAPRSQGKNIYGSEGLQQQNQNQQQNLQDSTQFVDQNTAYIIKNKYLPQSKPQIPRESLGSAYNTKPLTYNVQQYKDHGYPYPKSPTDLRNIYSSSNANHNKSLDLASSFLNKGTPMYGKNDSIIQNNNNNQNNNQNNMSHSYQPPAPQKMSQSAVPNRTRLLNSQSNQKLYDLQPKQQQEQQSNNLLNNLQENKSYIHQENQAQQQYYALAPQQEHPAQIQQQKSSLPDIKKDIQKAEQKAGMQPYRKGSYNPQQNYQYSANDNWNDIYNSNYGYKNVSNRYMTQQQLHKKRNLHIYDDVPKVAGGLFELPQRQVSAGQFNTNNNNNSTLMGQEKRASSKSFKPLNIISGKRHQEYKTHIDKPVWDYKSYDREQFKEWEGKQKHIKDIIKDKNTQLNSKKDFSTANKEYGVKWKV